MLGKMLERIKDKIPGPCKFTVPAYLCDGKYQSLSRYPDPDGRGYGVPGVLLTDLDKIFTDLIEIVPFQHNSELVRTLNYENFRQSPKKEKYQNWYEHLQTENREIDRLRKHV